jgi:hypothetical protein
MMNTPALDDSTRSRARYVEIRERISNGLWAVNRGMSSGDFNELMDKMTRLHLDFEQRPTDDRRGSDRRLGQPERRSVAGKLRLTRRPRAGEGSC